MSFIKNIRRRLRIINKLFRFLWERKIWWLIPLILILLLFALIIIFGQSSAISPFIYTLF